MTQSFTDWLQQSRLVVVAVDRARARVRVRGAEEVCTDLTCHEETLVVSDDEGPQRDLDSLNAGDIVRVESAGNLAHRIVVVRRVWDELSSPEF
jgi:Ni2+-binding GTPase involved in maturation of urease and hydrogenase